MLSITIIYSNALNINETSKRLIENNEVHFFRHEKKCATPFFRTFGARPAVFRGGIKVFFREIGRKKGGHTFFRAKRTKKRGRTLFFVPKKVHFVIFN
jgi:hypothetical protein